MVNNGGYMYSGIIRTFAVSLVLLFLAVACSKESGTEPPSPDPNPSGVYLGETPPALTPKIFSPGFISPTTSFDFAPTFSVDGTEIYFTRRAGAASAQNIYESHQVNGVWTTPAPVSFSAGYMAMEPHLTLDNRTIYFTWQKTGQEGIWAVDRTANGWSAARYVGQGMFVSSDVNGQIYLTDLRNNPATVSGVTLSGGLFTNYRVLCAGAHPCIAPDGSYIVFDVDGGTHLKVCFLQQNGAWGNLVDLSQHGLPVSAGIASISPDGNYLFYLYNSDICWVSTNLIKNLR